MSSSEPSDFDVESQTTTTSGDGEGVSEQVFVNMNQRDQNRWKTMTGLDPILGKGHHAHPLLAASRFVLERAACEILRDLPVDRIFDVGGAPKRTYHMLGSKGHFICPDLQPGDDRRRMECPVSARNNMCAHTFEECTCAFQAIATDVGTSLLHPRRSLKGPTAFLFVHSAYYIDPIDLWSSLVDDRFPSPCYVVGHDFREPFGGFFDEATWASSGDRVTMRVKGQYHSPYTHCHLPWTTGWRGPSGEAFEVQCIRSVGEFTFLWSVRPILTSAPVPKCLDDVVVDDPFVGPVSFSSEQKGRIMSNSRLMNISFDLDHVYRAGSVLYTHSGVLSSDVHLVTVPVTMLSAAEVLCVGRTRDAQLWADLTNRLKRTAEQQRLPPAIMAEAIILAAALGFVKHVNQEIDVMYTIQNRFGRFFTVVNELIAFRVPRVWNCCRYMCLVGVLIIPASVLTFWFSFSDDPHQERDDWIVWSAFVMIVGIWVGLLSLTHWALNSMYSIQLTHWRSSYRDARTISVEPGRRIPMNQSILPGSSNCAGAPQSTLPPTAIIERTLASDREMNSRTIDRAHLAGLCPDTVSVNVLEPTQDVEESFLRNRLFPVTPIVDESVVMEVTRWFVRLKERFDPAINFSRSAFYDWITTQRGKFTKPTIDSWIELYESLDVNEPVKQNSARTFTKLEKSSKYLTREGQKPVKPRGIAPPSDEHKVILGPIVSQLYKRACKFFGVASQTVYCSGLTTDRIGSLIDNFMETHGEENVTGIYLDCSNYDATLQAFQQMGYLNYLGSLGFTNTMINLLIETRVRGKTSTGVVFSNKVKFYQNEHPHLFGDLVYVFKKFEVPFEDGSDENGEFIQFDEIKMWSGRMDTNLADTLILAGVNETFLEKHKISVYLLLLCGDDMFLLGLKKDWTSELFDQLKSWYSGFGLIPEGAVTPHRWEWEFCSKLFWFGVDRKTGKSQTVLGPKVGRTLARFGMTVSIPTETNIAGAAQSLRRDASHVPFVRCVADRTYEICKTVRMKIKYGRSEWDPLKSDRAFDVDPKNYWLLERRYNITIEDEKRFLGMLSTIHVLPAFYHLECAEELAKVDE